MRRALRLVTLLLFCSGLFADPAFALSLNEAKAKGLVGERIDGFVGVVVADPPADVRELVDQVNSQRRQKYDEVAKQRGVPLDAVAKITGETQLERTPSGQYVLGADGQWRRK
jgi:uncharacterized protein YdbL (DUF1318 family)